jgi:hypothetical protein
MEVHILSAHSLMCLYPMCMYIHVLLSRKCLLFPHWLIPKSCDGPHIKVASPHGPAGRRLPTPALQYLTSILYCSAACVPERKGSDCAVN